MEKKSTYQWLRMKISPLYAYLMVAALCIGTLFLSSDAFIDAQILPKWFIMITFLLCGGAYYMICFAFYPSAAKGRK